MRRSHYSAGTDDPSLWDQFLAAVQRQQIKQGQRRWYALRAEQYIARYQSLPLHDHSPKELTSYLSELGRNNRLEDW